MRLKLNSKQFRRLATHTYQQKHSKGRRWFDSAAFRKYFFRTRMPWSHWCMWVGNFVLGWYLHLLAISHLPHYHGVKYEAENDIYVMWNVMKNLDTREDFERTLRLEHVWAEEVEAITGKFGKKQIKKWAKEGKFRVVYGLENEFQDDFAQVLASFQEKCPSTSLEAVRDNISATRAAAQKVADELLSAAVADEDTLNADFIAGVPGSETGKAAAAFLLLQLKHAQAAAGRSDVKNIAVDGEHTDFCSELTWDGDVRNARNALFDYDHMERSSQLNSRWVASDAQDAQERVQRLTSEAFTSLFDSPTGSKLTALSHVSQSNKTLREAVEALDIIRGTQTKVELNTLANLAPLMDAYTVRRLWDLNNDFATQDQRKKEWAAFASSIKSGKKVQAPAVITDAISSLQGSMTTSMNASMDKALQLVDDATALRRDLAKVQSDRAKALEETRPFFESLRDNLLAGNLAVIDQKDAIRFVETPGQRDVVRNKLYDQIVASADTDFAVFAGTIVEPIRDASLQREKLLDEQVLDKVSRVRVSERRGVPMLPYVPIPFV